MCIISNIRDKYSGTCNRQGKTYVIRAHVYMYEYRIYMCMGTYIMEEFDDTAGYWTIIPFLVLDVAPLNM